jgi:glycine/D-amino acid oxidase-like deaminating enzyme
MASQSYPSYQNTCGWNALLPRREDIRTLETDIQADVAVIGAGYTGISAARRWCSERRDDRVAILEASEIGEGNPGRNSGFLLEIALANDADATQLSRMHKCNHLISRTMNRLRDDVYDAGIQCDIERAGTYRAAAGDAGGRALDAYRRFLDAARLPYEPVSRNELGERLGTSYYRQGLYSPHCYLVQPAALIRGLAGLLPASAEIYERTPALSLRREANRWVVTTPAGRVEATAVLVANNAFAKRLGLAPSRVVAMYTYAGLTEPLSAEFTATLGSESSWGLLPTHRLGCTMRRTRDNRLLIRSHYGYEREDDNDSIGRALLASLRLRFPSLDIGRFARVWGGATGFTFNGAPVWGKVREGLYISAGCNGGGVVKGTLFGELLADLALGKDVPDVGYLFGNASWMPPDPIRRIGFEIISRIERRQGRAEM